MKGFRDFYPKEKRISNYIFNTWKEVALNYGYEEIDMPILEETKLYNKSGDEIPAQIYRFKDKSKRDVALRPETTPSIARMIKNNPNLKKPIKWFSISQCYRYEQLQKGRGREFFQFNLDYLGVESMQADAEVITTLIKIFTSFNLSENDFYIRISNRKLLNDLYKEYKIEKTKEVSRMLDKKGKIGDAEIREQLEDFGLAKGQVTALFNIFKIKDLNEIKIESKGLEELKQLFSILKDYNLDKFIELDLGIMRGFDYYTSTIFEAFDKNKKFRALAGGGRYDNLADMPGVGYGLGDIVLTLFLESKDLLPKEASETEVFIIPINTLQKSIKIAEQLRKDNLNVSIDLLKRPISKNLEYADRKQIPYVIIIGEDELKQRKVKLKNMTTGEERLISVEDVSKVCRP